MSARARPNQYGVREFDLSVSRTNERFRVRADRLNVVRADDSVDLRLGSPTAPAIPLRRLEEIEIPSGIEELYLSNNSGTGTLILLFGIEDVTASVGSAEIEGTVDVQDRAAREIGKARVQNSAGVLIDPATNASLTSVQPRSVDGTAQISDSDTGTGSSNAAQLALGDLRKAVDVWVDTSGDATLTVEVSEDGGSTWRQIDTQGYTGASSEIEQYETAFADVRAHLNQNRNEVVAVSRGI